MKCSKWTTFSELKACRKLLLNFVYYNFLFRYTLTKTLRLNRASPMCSQAAALFIDGIYNLSRTDVECTWKKKRMHLIFLGNLLLKCFLQQNQEIQPYSDNQIKEIKKRCIQNAKHKLWEVHWPMLAV